MRCFITLLLCIFLNLSAYAQSLLNVPVEVSEIIKKHKINPDEISLWVQGSDKDNPFANLNGNVARNPASVMKLVTTAAALIKLGGDYEWFTRFYVDELPDKQGVSHGNLYIVGGGNPFLVEEELETLLRLLQAKGLKRFTGNLVLDNRLFYLDEDFKGSLDGKDQAAYNALPDALMVNFRTLKILFDRQAKGGFDVRLWPHIASWTIKPEWQIVQGACNTKNYSPHFRLQRDDQGYATLHIGGKLASACKHEETLAVLGEGVEQFYYLFRDLWYRNGGTFDGYGTLGHVPEGRILLLSGGSRLLREQIKMMNQISNNVMTRQLLLTMAAEKKGIPGTVPKGREVIADALRELGLNPEHFYVDNGAGLSRSASVIPSQLAALLRLMRHSPYAEDYLESLAVAGEKGTLKRRFHNEIMMQGRVFGKTGTLDKVKAFAGYVRAQSRREYIIVLIVNGNSAEKSLSLQNDILRWLVRQ